MTDYSLLQDGDADDAANVNTLVGHPNLANYVADGLIVDSVDFTNDTFDLTAGKAFVLLDTGTTASDDETRHLCLQTFHFDAKADLPLQAEGLNHVYACFNTGTSDSPKIDVWSDQQEGNATPDSIKIAVIDADAETIDTDYSRAPDGLYEQLKATTIEAESLNVESITWEDGTEQDRPGIMAGETLNAENLHYDDDPSDGSEPNGKVRQSRHADEADLVGEDGTVAGAAVGTPIHSVNTQYDQDEDGVVDEAELAFDTDQFSGRIFEQLLYEFATKTYTGTIPRTELRPGEPTGFTQTVKGNTIKLWSFSLSTRTNKYGSLRLRFRSANGEYSKVFGSNQKQKFRRGDYRQQEPLFSQKGHEFYHIELLHTADEPIEASAVVNYTVE